MRGICKAKDSIKLVLFAKHSIQNSILYPTVNLKLKWGWSIKGECAKS